MPVPANRVPVRVARGTKEVLETNLSSFREGEVCFAKDEDSLYVVEGGALIPAGASSLDGLSDVDLTTPATDGQVLIWSDVDSAFLPGDASSVSSINDLSDVDVATAAPTDGQLLVWSAADSEWVVGSLAAGDLTDVITEVSGGDPDWSDVVYLFDGESSSEGGSIFTDLSPVGAGNGVFYGTAGELTTTAAAAKFGALGAQATPDPTTEFGVSYPYNSAYDLGDNDFTIEFYFQAPTSSDRGGSVIELSADGVADKYRWSVDMSTSGALSFAWTTDGSGSTYNDAAFSSQPGSTGVWHHYALVRGGIGGLNYNTTAVSPFPADAGPLPCTLNAVTGNGTGATVNVYTDASGNLSFPEDLSSGEGYQVGDQVTIDEDGGTGQFTATVSANDLRCYYNGNKSFSNRFISDTISVGDADNQLLFLGGHGVIGDRRNSAEGYFDEVRITKKARYTANFTPPAAAFANFGGGPQDGQVLTYVAANSAFEPVQFAGALKAASYSDLVGGQSVDSTTAAVVTGCTNAVTENSIYSNTAGVITISETGVYEIYGCVGVTGSTADYRWTGEYDVRVDGSMVARQVGGYIRATSASNYSDIAVTTIVPITAGQTVDFTLKRVSNVIGNAVVLAHTSRILIKKLS